MSIVWHIARKDIRRLQIPLLLWVLLLAAEVVLLIFTADDLAWLRRLSEPTPMLVRMFAPSIIAYLLVGWLVYGDSLVEPDPFWITRPISGWQLFAAKLVGALVMFVLPPLIINLPWWLASGFGWNEILGSAGMTACIFGFPVLVGIGVASATDSFQRYILWSFVALALHAALFAAMGSFATAILLPRLAGQGGSTLTGYLSGATVLALTVAAHQFLTRRLARSIGLTIVGAVVISTASALWVVTRPLPVIPPATDLGNVQLAIVGPSRVGRGARASNTVSVRLRPNELPADAAVTQLRFQAEWRGHDTVLWTTQVRGTTQKMMLAATRALLQMPPAAGTNGENERVVQANLPVAATSLQQIMEQSAAFQGIADFTVLRGKVLAEIPLRETTQRVSGRAFSITDLGVTPLNETARKRSAAAGEANDGNAISLKLIERLADEQALGFEIFKFRLQPTVYALVRRRTGEIIFSDPVSTGPIGLNWLNQVVAHSMGLRFIPPTTPGWMEEATLAVIRFGNPQTVQRTLTANPLALEMVEPAKRLAQ